MSTRTFHIGDLITVTSDRVVSPDGIDAVYRVIDYVTGMPHMTHQLPRAAEAVGSWLIQQHPWLDEITVPESVNSEETAACFVAEMIAQYGECHEVKPLPSGAYVGRDPMAELIEKVGADRVIPIELDPQGGAR